MSSIFSRELQLMSFTFSLRFLYELKHKVCLSKTACGIFHFRFRFVFIKVYIFVQQNTWTKMSLKRHNSFQNHKRKAAHSFASWPLIFQLQKELLKFNDICVCWSSQKTNLVTNVLNLKNVSFENVSFSLFSKYLTFLYSITYLFLFLTYLFISLN